MANTNTVSPVSMVQNLGQRASIQRFSVSLSHTSQSAQSIVLPTFDGPIVGGSVVLTGTTLGTGGTIWTLTINPTELTSLALGFTMYSYNTPTGTTDTRLMPLINGQGATADNRGVFAVYAPTTYTLTAILAGITSGTGTITVNINALLWVA